MRKVGDETLRNEANAIHEIIIYQFGNFTITL